jgi:2-C-methyl-D-erythritol 4-phosphate cytidylyltransferase
MSQRFAVVLLTAAPVGQALEAGGAYVRIDGREALLRSVELFVNRDGIEQIMLVVASDALDEAKRKFGAHFGLSGVKLVSSGVKWIEQLQSAAEKLSAEVTHVIVHDAARPATPYTDIDHAIEASRSHDAVAIVNPVRSTLVELEKGKPVRYHAADQFVQLATPQVFGRERFLEIARTGAEVPAAEAHLVKGSSLNVRIAGPGDERLIKAMLTMLPKPKVRPPSSPFEEAQW